MAFQNQNQQSALQQAAHGDAPAKPMPLKVSKVETLGTNVLAQKLNVTLETAEKEKQLEVMRKQEERQAEKIKEIAEKVKPSYHYKYVDRIDHDQIRMIKKFCKNKVNRLTDALQEKEDEALSLF